jgi:LuxR family transcriptional regulator, maltose regulon positive regulatory protein
MALDPSIHAPASKGLGVRNRPRLLSQIDRIKEFDVVLIAAGGGYGKSYLAKSWTESQADERVVVWARPAGPESLPDLAAAARELADRIPAGGESGIIVVDDPIRTWPSPTIERAAAFAESAPPNSALIVCSRDGRTRPWKALQSEGRLSVIGPRELAFEDEEAVEALEAWAGMSIPSEVCIQANTLAEGWVTGLRLTADELRWHHGDPRIIPAWPANSDDLASFLAYEVLATMSGEDSEFVEVTAELPSLEPLLCDHLTGRHDSADRLDHLVLASCFTERVADVRGLYRYHRIFAAEMARRRRSRDPQAARRTLGEASDWYRAQGDTDLAVEAGLRAGDGARVAALLRAVSGPKLRGGEAAQLVAWMERMPQADLWRDPALALALARACGLSGDSMTPRAVLRATQADPAMIDPPLGLRIVRAQLESSIFGWEGRIASMGEPLRDIPTRLGSLVEDPYLQICAIDETAMSNCRMRALLLTGHLEEAVSTSETSLTPAELHCPSRYTVAAVGLHALALAWAGHVPEAREAIRQGRKVLARFHGAGDDAVWLHVATAWVGDPVEATESLAQIEEFAAGSGLPYRRVLAALSGLALHVRLGQSSEVARAFAVADREIHGLPEPGYFETLLEGFRTDSELLGEPSEALNPQEVVMLRLLARGATRSRIAHETSYSVNTVKAYLRSAYRKLGVADREQAVAAAVAIGIVVEASVARPEDENG